MDVVKQLEEKLAEAKSYRDTITETDKLILVLENRTDVRTKVVLELEEGVKLDIGCLHQLGFGRDELLVALHKRADTARRQLAQLV